jgi:hypothetical protein
MPVAKHPNAERTEATRDILLRVLRRFRKRFHVNTASGSVVADVVVVDSIGEAEEELRRFGWNCIRIRGVGCASLNVQDFEKMGLGRAVSCLEAVEKAVLVHDGCIREANAVAERMGRARHSMMRVEIVDGRYRWRWNHAGGVERRQSKLLVRALPKEGWLSFVHQHNHHSS